MTRNYSNIALDTTLTAGIGVGDPTCVVASASGWPSAPFAAVLDPGLATEEVVQVTIKVGTTFTITRAFDGTTAQAHALGATVRHSAIAGDFTDLQAAITSEASTRAAADLLLAPIASPTLTGIPAAPTAAPGTNTTQLATTAFVLANGAGVTDGNKGDVTVSGVGTVWTVNALPESRITNLVADLALKAPLASPTFTGTPAAPTAAPGTNTTQLATTAFVVAGDALNLKIASNLSDVANVTTARGNLSAAPLNATYITQTANSELSAEQALSALATGYVKNTTGTGVLSVQAVPIPLADGGTNATSAAAALTSLGAAPSNATYITQIAEAGLSAEQALSSLATGYMKVTTTTGVISSQATPIPSADLGSGGAGGGTKFLADDQTFKTISAGGVSSVTASSPLASSGGATPDISLSGTVPVANGGTGLTSYAVGDILYASGATTLSKLADVATGNVLISGGITTAPSWGKVDLTAHVTGILPSANGGTGVNNAGKLTTATDTTFTGGGTWASGGFTGTLPATGTFALLATSQTFTATHDITITDASANSTTTVLTLTRDVSSGTPGIGMGSRLLLNLQSATVADRNAASIDTIWLTATDASRVAAMIFNTANNTALSECLRLSATGISAIGGNTNATFTSGSLRVTNNGGAASMGQAQSSANSALQIIGSSGIASGQFIDMQFGSVPTARFAVAPADVSSAAVVDNLILRRNPTSGTPAAGTGHQIHLVGKSDTTADRDQLTLSVEYVVATDASRTNRAKLSIYDTAAREGLRIEASGSAPMIGFLGAAASIRQTGGENLTNNVTSGGTDGTIANFTDLTIYANDSAAIRNDIYQLARSEKQIRDALRLYGLLT